MICPIPNGKSDSSWLDRLRISKGFPPETGLELEHFLNPSPSSPDPSDSPPKDRDQPSSNQVSTTSDEFPDRPLPRSEKKSDDLFQMMSSVLSELFNMGDHQGIVRVRAFDERKRTFRKQPNPKICLPSSSGSVEESCGVQALSPPSTDNSVAEAKRSDGRSKLEKQGHGISCPGEEISQAVAMDVDLSAISRTEVTIIDTSDPSWKSEKLIFRKASVWKIRGKKQSSRKTFRKKRKVDETDDGAAGEKKLYKRSSLALKSCNLISSTNALTGNEKGGTLKEKPDNLSQILGRRPQSSRSPRKPATKDSSVFLIKCIPASRKKLLPDAKAV